jgi:ribosomal protein S18 acetylase RimI-like enzyme
VSVEVVPLDLGDDATLQRLVELQQASYSVEAELIGAPSLPPMDEPPEQLRAAGETFLGARRGGELVGAVSYKREGGTVDVHRLVVDPAAFRGGVATALLDALDAREADATEWLVGTGEANAPARTLYERRGFAVTERREYPQGVRYVRMRRTS